MKNCTKRKIKYQAKKMKNEKAVASYRPLGGGRWGKKWGKISTQI